MRAPSSLITPNWHHRVPACIFTASAAIAGSALGARKTFTMSTGSGTSDRLLKLFSPKISVSRGFTGMTRYPWRLR
jgi:hypothetical protein